MRVSTVAVNVVLVKEKASSQFPVYYESKHFGPTENKYIERYLYALIIVAQMLCLYFHAHEIIVLTEIS